MRALFRPHPADAEHLHDGLHRLRVRGNREDAVGRQLRRSGRLRQSFQLGFLLLPPSILGDFYLGVVTFEFIFLLLPVLLLLRLFLVAL